MRDKTSPRLFFARNAGLGASPVSVACPPACSLCPSGVVRSHPLHALLVVRRGVRRGVVCRAVVRCDEARRSSLVPRVGRRIACLRFSSRGPVRAVDRLPLRGSSRLIGAGGGVGLPLLAWMGLAEKYGDYVDRLLSVDYSGAGVYINNRALMVSPFVVSWHVLVVRAAFLCFCRP